MSLFNVVCDGPGPHDPADGVVGESNIEGLTGMRCAAAACQPQPPEMPSTVAVQVDPDAVAAALTAAAKSTTIAGLRAAVISLGQQLQPDVT